MNYAFLLVLAVFLVISAPFLLIGAYREGKRRREARDLQDAQRDAQKKVDMAAQELGAIARLAPPRALQQEEIYRYAYMILQAYQQREDLPTNKLAAPKSPGLKLSELLYEVAERDRPASKA